MLRRNYVRSQTKEDPLQDHRLSIISALHKLPSEIWQEIFYLLCDGEQGRYSFHAWYPYSGQRTDYSEVDINPQVLSHVCSLWGEIINNSPRIWSSIYISVSSKLHPRVHVPLAVHLRNSRDYPLRLHTVSSTYFRQRELLELPVPAPEIFNILLPHLWRCRVLELCWGSWKTKLEDVVAAENPSPFTFTHLTDVCFDMVGLKIDPTCTFWKALAEAPMLRKVKIQEVLGVDAIPYHRLTELRVMDPPDFDNLFHVLSVCQSLQSLHLSGGFIAPQFQGPGSTTAPVVLPSIRDMQVLISVYPDDLCQLFDKFIFPSLREFRVLGSPDAGESKMICRPKVNWAPIFLQRFERSALRIERLYLDFAELSLDDEDILDIVPILVMTPSLTRLEVKLSFQFSYKSDGDTSRIGFLLRFLLNQLKISAPGSSTESPVLLPILTHLYLYDDSHRWWNIDLVRSVLESLGSRSSLNLRGRTEVSPLSVIHLIHCDTLES